jgi:hypothetical protein
MSIRSRARALVVAIALIASGCLLGTSLDGLAGSDTVDGGADASADTAPVVEARDASPLDVAQPPLVMNCAAERDAAFCSDFDDLRLEYGWDALDVVAGSATQDDAAATTPPFSFLTSSLVGGDVVESDVTLEKTFPLAPKRMHASFDVRIDAIALQTGSEVMYFRAQLENSNTGNYYTLSLSHETTGLIVSQQNYVDGTAADVGPHFTLSRAPVVASWSHVDVDINFAAQPRTFLALLNGVPVGNGSLYPSTFTTPLRILLGIRAYAIPGGVKARFDHFVLRIE